MESKQQRPQIRLAKHPKDVRNARGQFAQGNNSNPGGQRQFKPLSAALRAALNADEMAYVLINAAKAEDARYSDKIAAIKEIADRTEGKATQAIRVTGEVDPNTLAKLTELAALLK